MADFSELVGKRIKSVQNEYDEITFETFEGNKYLMYHAQRCCESVTVEDINGDLQDLVGEVIILAEERTSDTPESGEDPENYGISCTWTFYTIMTRNSTVDIRWFGTSNGYYSERVDFIDLNEEEKW